MAALPGRFAVVPYAPVLAASCREPVAERRVADGGFRRRGGRGTTSATKAHVRDDGPRGRAGVCPGPGRGGRVPAAHAPRR